MLPRETEVLCQWHGSLNIQWLMWLLDTKLKLVVKENFSESQFQNYMVVLQLTV